MYTSVYLLNQSNYDKSKKYQDRWRTKEGLRLKQHILKRLTQVTSHALLQKELVQNKPLLLESASDLQGLSLLNENLKAGYPDVIKNSDLSFLYAINTNFDGFNFAYTTISFSNLYNVTFRNCMFSYSTLYANVLENVTFVNCDFTERNDVRNCRFTNVTFEKCFIERNLFHSCRFDERTSINRLSPISHHAKKRIIFNRKELAELYKAMKNSYKAGKVINKSRDCYFLERQAITRFILDNKIEKYGNYALEIIAGYGIKPLRVLFWMVSLFIVFSLLFIGQIGYPDGLLLSTGAYFTNGAGTNHLEELDFFYKSLFILESFLGTFFTTIFVTVMANLWLRER